MCELLSEEISSGCTQLTAGRKVLYSANYDLEEAHIVLPIAITYSFFFFFLAFSLVL